MSSRARHTATWNAVPRRSASGGPTAMITSRQNLPVLEGTSAEGVAQGAYVLREAADAAITLVGTGSEVAVCVEAADRLGELGVVARVVSTDLLAEEGGEKPWELVGASGGGVQRQRRVQRVLPAFGVHRSLRSRQSG